MKIEVNKSQLFYLMELLEEVVSEDSTRDEEMSKNGIFSLFSDSLGKMIKNNLK